MANFELLIPHILVSEGGHSADPDDNALKYGHSGIKGGKLDKRYPNDFIHTNRGIIWGTYVTYKKIKKQTPNANEFINMSAEIWRDIYKTLYWDKILGDKIKSQGIAEILVEAAWGGGISSMVRELQTWLNSKGAKLVVDGAIGNNTINALNSIVKTKELESALVKKLTEQRLGYLRSLSDWRKYAKGWTDRVMKMQDRALQLVTSPPAIITGSFLLLSIAGYFIYKNYYKS